MKVTCLRGNISFQSFWFCEHFVLASLPMKFELKTMLLVYFL